jgi:uncharacterized protein (DUF2235 family)
MSDSPLDTNAVKNIVICSDGTGNSAIKDRGTNVFKLYEAVDADGWRIGAIPKQIAFYDDGVGTQELLPVRLLGQAFGFGLARNVRELYADLARVFEPGDKIFLFGFSRGAYTVRTLLGLIECCGIPDRKAFTSDAALREAVDENYAEYRKKYRTFWGRWKPEYRKDDPDRRRRLNAVTHPRLAPDAKIYVEFIGVWDTVCALGMPFDELAYLWDRFIYPFRFADGRLTPQVACARHALSIDDERRTFQPTMWDEQGAAPGQIEQVWFSGVHANVGGGYPKQGMSLVTLDWMMAQAEARGLRFIKPDRESIRAHWDVNDKLYDSRAGLGVYYRWDPRDVAKICADNHMKPRIHCSVFERIAQGTKGYAPGNIPADLEVVGTPGTLGPTRLAEIQKLVNTELSAVLFARRAASLLGTPHVQGWVAAGKLAYYGFLALTVAGVCYGVRDVFPPLDGLNAGEKLVRLAGSAGSELSSGEELLKIAYKLLQTWWFDLGLALCYGLSWLVDKKMEWRYSEFWYRLEYRLRALL